jgi:TPR repeat protein
MDGSRFIDDAARATMLPDAANLGIEMSRVRAMVVAVFLALSAPQLFAAELDPEAMNRIGIRYATGSGVPQDFVAALAWYQRAAEHGSVRALNNIATLHFHGLGVPQSYEEAVKWLRLAVAKGDAAAQNRLGAMYEEGLGVPQSAHDAFELFDRAAAQGYGPGMANLGHAYAGGTGVQRDEVRAYALIAAAIEIGVPRTQREAAIYELGALSQRLDGKQVERAQADARALLETRSKETSVATADAQDAYRL